MTVTFLVLSPGCSVYVDDVPLVGPLIGPLLATVLQPFGTLTGVLAVENVVALVQSYHWYDGLENVPPEGVGVSVSPMLPALGVPDALRVRPVGDVAPATVASPATLSSTAPAATPILAR